MQPKHDHKAAVMAKTIGNCRLCCCKRTGRYIPAGRTVMPCTDISTCTGEVTLTAAGRSNLTPSASAGATAMPAWKTDLFPDESLAPRMCGLCILCQVREPIATYKQLVTHHCSIILLQDASHLLSEPQCWRTAEPAELQTCTPHCECTWHLPAPL